MEIIIVTGLSGAGKSRSINSLEDMGFYCVDNMPPKLIHKFVDICLQSDGKLNKIAIVTDIRGGEMFSALPAELEEMRREGIPYKILFLEAADEVLINRYKQTRRRHPLMTEGFTSVDQAITAERNMLNPIRENADYVIDTTFLSDAQLKERIKDLFKGQFNNYLIVNVISFGFKFGIPKDADLVFDVRCFPNPFYIEALRPLTGKDKEVYDYVMGFPETKVFAEKFVDMIDFLIPLYEKEGKSQLVIAVGCTGGRHRSVTLAEYLYQHLQQEGYEVRANHRDITK